MRNDLTQVLLVNRGITDSAEQELFLSPNYERDIHDPFLMPDMDKAITRIYQAIKNGEKIVVYADYDCDGIPGAVVLHDFFKKLNYTHFEIYIPDRHDEGYGLNHDAIEQFIQNKVALIITVDLGTSDASDISYAQENGIDVIVTDHHLPPEILPGAFALVNPKVPGSIYPDPMLCGAGVAFKLVQGFLKKYGEAFAIPVGWEKWLLDMVGLATLSDMVPLRNENRIFAQYGLKVLRKSPRPGLQKILTMMKIDQRYLNEEDLTFMLTPRINAASRMDSPMRAFELLSETDPAKAGALATHLSKINDERKTTVATIMREVHKKLETREKREVIVIGNPLWRPGVLGLVAGKITEHYACPAFVWGGSEEGEMFKGSCRSDGSINVVELMRETETSFASFGGHELAGGFSVSREHVFFLEDTLIEAYTRTKRQRDAEVKNTPDAVLTLADLTISTWEQISLLAPFGSGNGKPVFRFENIQIASVRQFGKEKNHLEVMFETNKKLVKAIAFFTTIDQFTLPLTKGDQVTLIAHLELSYFLSRPELRLRIVDILRV